MPIANSFAPVKFATAGKEYNDVLYADRDRQQQEAINRENILASVHNRAQTAALNLESIANARADREKAREMLDLEKKKTNIAVQEAEMKGNVSKMGIEMMKKQMNEGFKQKETELKAHDVLADSAEHKHHNDFQQSIGMLSAIGQGQFSQAPMAQPQPVQPQKTPMQSSVSAFGGGARPMPSIPFNGAVKAQPEEVNRYEMDLSKAVGGDIALQETSAWKAQEKAKEKAGEFSVNALKIDANDKELLNQVHSLRQNGTPVSKEEIMSNLSPETATSIQGLIEYTDDPKSYSTRNNARVEAIRMARMVDPSYDPVKFDERKKFRMDLANDGSYIGKQRVALNTVAQHMAQLDGYIDALGGGNIKPVNMVVNFAKEITGNPNITNYEQAQEAVTSEMQRLLTGVGVTQSGMAEARKIVDKNTGYEAKKAALKSLVRIVEGRITPLKQGYEKKMGKAENGEIVYPETQEIFDRYLGNKSEQDNIDEKVKQALAAGYTMEEVNAFLKR